MREIAYEGGVIYDIGKPAGDVITVSRVRDPYFESRLIEPFDLEGPTHNFYMIDHNPVLIGATYQYLMVLFTERGEIKTVLPLNPISVQF